MKQFVIRYIFSISLPPVIGTIGLMLSFIASDPENAYREVSANLFLAYLAFAFIFCLIPGSLFFAAHEGICRLGQEHFKRRFCYIALGGALGLPCGVGLGALLEIVPTFSIVGIVAGATTSWVNYYHRDIQ